jgi:type 1 glutamine amidotransferase
LLVLLISSLSVMAADKIKVLIIDGQNNHNWREGTPAMKWILEDSGRFTVDVSTAPDNKADAEAWKQWRPKFEGYDVLLSNYNGKSWPEEVRQAFLKFVQDGGGLVIIHAADNSFPEWPEYNEMIGLGGWGGRNEKSGPMIRYKDGKVVFDNSPGGGGTHGKQHEFVVETRDAEHPIMKGLPPKWKHAIDELYSKLRGPAKNLTVLATAYAAPEQNGTGENEPIFMTINYGKGRVFHDVLGHGKATMVGVGFQVTLLRGTEWAATGKVTIAPDSIKELSAEKAAIREIPQEVFSKDKK